MGKQIGRWLVDRLDMDWQMWCKLGNRKEMDRQI